MRLKILPVILLAMAIALSPSFFLGKIDGGRIIELRVEDFLLVLLTFFWIGEFLLSGRGKIKKPPLFSLILIWLGFGTFSVLLNWLLGNITPSRGFFYFLKEIEFFLIYFFVFYHLCDIDSVKLIVKTWIFLGAANVLWIIYETVTHSQQTFYYGPTAFFEPTGTLPSGGFFLVIFTFLLNLLLYYFLALKISNVKKAILTILAISPAIGVFASGSRASFWGINTAVLFTLIFYLLKKGVKKSLLIGICSLVVVSLAFVFVLQNVPGVGRVLSFQVPTDRIWLWGAQVEEFSKQPGLFLFGMGKSAFLVADESHSQYIRNLVETGAIGSLLFLVLVSGIIKKGVSWFFSSQDHFSGGLAIGAAVATISLLVIGISAEVFIVVKVMEIYWFFVAIAMASLSLKSQS